MIRGPEPAPEEVDRIRRYVMMIARVEYIHRKSGRTTMSELSLEGLARRLEEVERRLNEKEAGRAKDWRMAAGMFTGRDFSKIVDEEGRKIRDADREAACQEFGE
jgi:hypothetical protein